MPTSKAECPECGAKPGKPCLSTRGKTVGQPIAGGKLHPKRVMHEVEVPIVDLTEGDVHIPAPRMELGTDRKERISQVLWGIHFARNVMNISQEAIDLHLAEMVVDAELDLKLF